MTAIQKHGKQNTYISHLLFFYLAHQYARKLIFLKWKLRRCKSTNPNTLPLVNKARIGYRSKLEMNFYNSRS